MVVEQQNTLHVTFTGREVDIFKNLVRLAFHAADDCSEEEDLAAIIMNRIEDL